jgi:hypothetical protein
MKKILTTKQLFDLVSVNPHKIIETSLLLNFKSRATHFISLEKSLLFDEGIDGELIKWERNEFISQYEYAEWVIDQIISKKQWQ